MYVCKYITARLIRFFVSVVLVFDLKTLNILLSEIKIYICDFKLFHRFRSIHWCYALHACIICACVHSFEIFNCSAFSSAHLSSIIISDK